MKDRFYIDSLPYEIELTARVCHENARRLIESYTDKLSIEEFSVLDTIIARPNLSQADLARLILKGKAHTGRFLMSLEEKGLIERHVEERYGKLIKVPSVTEKGNILYKDITENLKPSIKKFQDAMSDEEVDKIITQLRALRSVIESVSNIVFE